MNGFVKLPRTLWGSAVWPAGRFSRFEAYVDLLGRASFHSTTVSTKYGPLYLDPGEVLCSAAGLARAWSWPESTVKNFINELEQAKLLTKHRRQRLTVLALNPEAAKQLSAVRLESDPPGAEGSGLPLASDEPLARSKDEESLNSVRDTKREILELLDPPPCSDRGFAHFVAGVMKSGRKLVYDHTLLERLRAEYEAQRKSAA